MRLISHTALLVFIGITALHVMVAALGWEQLWTFVVFQAVTMAFFSLSVSNFGAMAMDPIGSVAGIGASLQGFIQSFGGAFVGAAIGRLFNGTTVPLAGGALALWFDRSGVRVVGREGAVVQAAIISRARPVPPTARRLKASEYTD